jgi:hypothetical protein
MLVDSFTAARFLVSYKTLLAEVNGGKKPEGVKEFVRCRGLLFANPAKIGEYRGAGEDIKDAVRKAVYGRFIFLKKYKGWYAFQYMTTGRYYAALALTSPIESMLEDFSVIWTALVPWRGGIVCDGLIAGESILLGKNMMRECRQGYMEAKRCGELIKELK